MPTPFIEPLEARIAPATIVVTSNADSGPGTLRDAIAQANADILPDIISFNLPADQTVIELATQLSAITTPVIIDGTTQPGYTNSPLVTVSASMATFDDFGFQFLSGSESSVLRGLVIRNFSDTGIRIQADSVGVSGTHISGNTMGISVSGDNVSIGVGGPGGGVVINGNAADGIFAEFADNLSIQNTIIGLSADGTLPLGNGGNGIFLRNCGFAAIGTQVLNVISANGGNGIQAVESFTEVRISGNYIGLLASGSVGMGSGNGGAGIHVLGGANHLIGTPDGGAANYIANNASSGIIVDTFGDGSYNGSATIAGNYIGIAPGGMGGIPASNGGSAVFADGPGITIGTTGSPNFITSNARGIATGSFGSVRIGDNFFQGIGGQIIDILNDGLTANDPNDLDDVPNFPVLDGAFIDAMGSLITSGSITGEPNTEYSVDIYGIVGSTYSKRATITVQTDETGRGDILQPISSSVPLDGVAALARKGTSELASEMSPTAIVAPAIFFEAPETISQAEGNTGVVFVNFTVRMTSAPTGQVTVNLGVNSASTAIQGVDYTFTPSVLTFGPATTQQTVTVAITGDSSVEPREFIHFTLSGVMGNGILIPSSKTVEILNDDTSLKVSPDGKTATWLDVDGDTVTLKSTKPILDAADFTMNAEGLLGGEVLQALNLGDEGAAAKGAGLKFTAKFDKANNRGDGSVHVGAILAGGVDLGIVTLPGDLGRISTGDGTIADGSIKSLTVWSMGALGLTTQGDNASLYSSFTGRAGAITIKGDAYGIVLEAATGMSGNPSLGSFGNIVITGSLISDGTPGSGRIHASGSIASVKIGGSVLALADGEAGSILAEEKIGSVAIAGSLRSTNDAWKATIQAGTTLGKVVIGELDRAIVFAQGNPEPAKTSAALAIAGIQVKGRVVDSIIQAGGGNVGSQNPDVQIGSVKVGGDWIRSNLTAGASPGSDARYGTADDVVLTAALGYSDNGAILARVASITIGGHIYGTTAEGDSFGFVAQSIGSFKRGGVAYTLRPNPTPNAQPLDVVPLAIQRDVFLREIL